jgi:hypothetical protein
MAAARDLLRRFSDSLSNVQGTTFACINAASAEAGSAKKEEEGKDGEAAPSGHLGTFAFRCALNRISCQASNGRRHGDGGDDGVPHVARVLHNEKYIGEKGPVEVRSSECPFCTCLADVGWPAWGYKNLAACS